MALKLEGVPPLHPMGREAGTKEEFSNRLKFMKQARVKCHVPALFVSLFALQAGSFPEHAGPALRGWESSLET